MNQNLITYLQKVYQLEATKFTLNRMITQLSNRADKLGFTRKIADPTRPISLFSWTIFFKWGIGLGIVVSLIYAIIVNEGSWESFNAILQIIKVAINTFLGCFIFIPIGLVVSFIVAIIARIIDYKKTNSRYMEKQKEVEFHRGLEQQRVKQELNIKQDIVNQISILRMEINEINNTLKQYYDLNIIHPKYRSLIPVTSFCEYLETGRCSQLEGHEGAYNIFENEIRLDKIATQIEVVIQHLDRIEQNQYYLYQTISDSNKKISQVMARNEQMIKSLGQIRDNTELAAYNSYVSSVNTSAISDMMVIRQLFR